MNAGQRRIPPRAAAGIGLGVLLFAVVLAGRFGGFGVTGAGALAEAGMSTVRGLGALGWLVFMAAQIVVATIGIIPASLLGVAAGATYGIGFGFLLSGVGTLIGGWLAFVLSRSLLRDWVEARLARRADRTRLYDVVAQDGWRLVCLLRISPIMPFAIASYALGLTDISMRHYMLGTLAAMPALLGYVTVGALAGMGLSAEPGQASILRMLLLCLGGVATLLLTLRLGRLIRLAGVLRASSK